MRQYHAFLLSSKKNKIRNSCVSSFELGLMHYKPSDTEIRIRNFIIFFNSEYDTTKIRYQNIYTKIYLYACNIVGKKKFKIRLKKKKSKYDTTKIHYQNIYTKIYLYACNMEKNTFITLQYNIIITNVKFSYKLYFIFIHMFSF